MTSNRKLYILCGGESRRMGRDKAMVMMEGESLLERHINKASLYFDEIVLLSGNKEYPVEIRHLRDPIESAGPLAGLLAALKDGDIHSLNHITIIPVDLPDLSKKTMENLSASKPSEPEDAVLLNSGTDLQPLAGVYRTDLLDNLEHYLKSGNRMVFGFINSLNYSVIEVAPDELRNLNSPEDLV